MTITVTSEDIEKGQRRKSQYCPLALAIRRQTGEACVFVGFSIAAVGDRDLSLPRKAQEFVRRFDEGTSVEPFTFKL